MFREDLFRLPHYDKPRFGNAIGHAQDHVDESGQIGLRLIGSDVKSGIYAGVRLYQALELDLSRTSK